MRFGFKTDDLTKSLGEVGGNTSRDNRRHARWRASRATWIPMWSTAAFSDWRTSGAAERGETAVVEEPALLVRPQSGERSRAVYVSRRTIGLE